MTRNVIDIAEIIVHPLYNTSISPYYNNIAVVKLKSFAPIEPFCVWYGDPNPGQELLITGQQVAPEKNSKGMYHHNYSLNSLVDLRFTCQLLNTYSCGLLGSYTSYFNILSDFGPVSWYSRQLVRLNNMPVMGSSPE